MCSFLAKDMLVFIGRKASTWRESITPLAIEPAIASKTVITSTVCIIRNIVYLPFIIELHHLIFKAWCKIKRINIPIPSHSCTTSPAIEYDIRNRRTITIQISTVILTFIISFIYASCFKFLELIS